MLRAERMGDAHAMPGLLRPGDIRVAPGECVQAAEHGFGPGRDAQVAASQPSAAWYMRWNWWIRFASQARSWAVTATGSPSRSSRR
jgi:hypothetical protein